MVVCLRGLLVRVLVCQCGLLCLQLFVAVFEYCAHCLAVYCEADTHGHGTWMFCIYGLFLVYLGNHCLEV